MCLDSLESLVKLIAIQAVQKRKRLRTRWVLNRILIFRERFSFIYERKD